MLHNSYGADETKKGRFMKQILLIALFIFAGTPLLAESSPDVVASVDLKRYSGQWFEIAHSKNFFQRNCLKSQARYEVLDSRTLSVLNSCVTKFGTTEKISGEAKVVDPKTPAKLKVRFNLLARGDYWITELDPGYQWAVVSGPDKKSLFILARQAPMPQDLLQNILATLRAKKYDISKLVFDQY